MFIIVNITDIVLGLMFISFWGFIIWLFRPIN